MSSIIQTIFENRLLFPQKTALIFEDTVITYEKLCQKVKGFAHSLKKRGVKKGSRIVIEADDLVSFFVAFLGCHLVNCIAVPVEKDISIYRLQEILKATKPVLVFMKNNGENYEDFIYEIKEESDFKFPKEDTVCTITSTTGTTGNPVLVTDTNKSMLATVENLISGVELTMDTVLFSNLPFDLAGGYRRVLTMLYLGATAVISHQPLSEELLIEKINRHNINHIALLPSKLNVLVDAKNPSLVEALGNVQSVETVSGPLAGVMALAFHKRYPKITLYHIYGTTESGCVLIHNTADNLVEGCIGKATKNAEVFLIDENGNRIEEPGKYGHIALRGEMNMVGYYRKKSLTEKVMPDDYIIIYDIAYFDEEGYFYFVSRVSDIIDVNGHKIIPQEIEQVASQYSEILECACVAEDNAKAGQIPILYIVCKEEKSFELENLKEYLKNKLEPYKIPEKIILIQKIPRTATGKIIRKSLSMTKYF